MALYQQIIMISQFLNLFEEQIKLHNPNLYKNLNPGIKKTTINAYIELKNKSNERNVFFIIKYPIKFILCINGEMEQTF